MPERNQNENMEILQDFSSPYERKYLLADSTMDKLDGNDCQQDICETETVLSGS